MGNMENTRETQSQEPAHRRMSRREFLDFAKICIGVGLAGPLLTACGEASPLVTPDATVIPPSVTATQPATATSRPAETPTIGFAKEEDVAYVEPTLEDMEIVLNAGGSGRESLLSAIGTDREKADSLVKLYDAAADEWVKASGYDPSTLTREYSMNSLPDKLFRWTMWHRDASGNILWAKNLYGKYNKRPTVTPVDQYGIPRADTAWKAVPLSNSTGQSSVIFKDENLVNPVAVRNPVTVNKGTPEEKTYWLQWFNTEAGEWETQSDVEALIPKVPEFYRGLPRSLEQAVEVTDEELKVLVEYFSEHQQLTAEYPKGHDYIIGKYKTSTERGAVFSFFYGENGIIDTLVQKKDQFGGSNIFIVIWELRDPDGRCRIYVHELINGDKGKHREIAEMYFQRLLTIKKTGDTVRLMPITHKNVNQGDVDPAYWKTANGADEEPDQRIYGELENAPKILPEGIEKVRLNGSVTVDVT
jgi:hypothetical protein